MNSLKKIEKIIKEKILQTTAEITLNIEQPEKGLECYRLSTTINSEAPIIDFIFIQAQDYTLYHFPLPVFKKVVDAIAEYFREIGKKVTVKEAPCAKCPQFLRCKLNSPTISQLETMGVFTEIRCVVFKEKLERSFLDTVLTPIEVK